MPGLRWTHRGAVALPETLQVRVAPLFVGRLPAGAPEPARALAAEEVAANVRWFTDPGPRGRPVSGLVLSGLPEDPAPLAVPVADGRARSLRVVVAHVDGPQVPAFRASPLAPLVDRWVVVARRAADVVADVEVVVPLEAEVLAEVGAIAAAASGVRRLVLTWPYPRGDRFVPPPISAVLGAVRGALPHLARIEWTLKGLPACLTADVDPGLVDRSARASNRWYVDAEHQRERALLFQPDVLQLAKQEACRFCAVDPRCDGVAERWLRGGLVPSFLPIRDETTGGHALR